MRSASTVHMRLTNFFKRGIKMPGILSRAMVDGYNFTLWNAWCPTMCTGASTANRLNKYVHGVWHLYNEKTKTRMRERYFNSIWNTGTSSRWRGKRELIQSLRKRFRYCFSHECPSIFNQVSAVLHQEVRTLIFAFNLVSARIWKMVKLQVCTNLIQPQF